MNEEETITKVCNLIDSLDGEGLASLDNVKLNLKNHDIEVSIEDVTTIYNMYEAMKASAVFEPEARLWQVERRVGGPTSYFIVIVDGEKEIPFELKHDPVLNSFQADGYSTNDYDYTVHDACDHEAGYCVCETDDYISQEFEDSKMFAAARKIHLLHNQVRQQKIAERILADKKEDYEEEAKQLRIANGMEQ